MEEKKQEKIMRTNLYNISNNTYHFLKEKQEDDRVIIEKILILIHIKNQ